MAKPKFEWTCWPKEEGYISKKEPKKEIKLNNLLKLELHGVNAFITDGKTRFYIKDFEVPAIIGGLREFMKIAEKIRRRNRK